MSYEKAHTLRRAALGLSVLVFCPIIIAACQIKPHKAQQPSSDSAMFVEAMRIAGDRSVFELPHEAVRKTPRANLLKLVDALDEAYAALDYQPPFPNVRIVNPSHPRLRGHALGVAAMTADGEARLYFSRTDLVSRRDLKPLILHELAHLKAWRMHGFDIAAYGPEFTKICRSVSRPENCTAQEG